MDDRLAFLAQHPADLADGSRHVSRVFEHRQPAGGGGPAALHYWPPRTAAPPAHVVLFILGNPGLLDYYVAFLDSLAGLLPPDYAVLSTSHIGHTPGLPAPAPLALAAQLDAKLELVSALRGTLDSLAGAAAGPAAASTRARARARPRARLVLVGHSVGAWLACESIKRLPGAVDDAALLFPTLGWIAESRNGRVLWPIFRWPARHLLPYLSLLLRPILPLTTLPAPTLALLRSPSTIAHALALGASEMRAIRAPDLAWLTAHAHQLSGVWAAAGLDGWVGRDGPAVRAALADGGGERVRVVDGVPHAFCLTQAHSELVAEIVAGWVVPGKDVAVGKHDAVPAPASSAVPM